MTTNKTNNKVAVNTNKWLGTIGTGRGPVRFAEGQGWGVIVTTENAHFMKIIGTKDEAFAFAKTIRQFAKSGDTTPINVAFELSRH